MEDSEPSSSDVSSQGEESATTEFSVNEYRRRESNADERSFGHLQMKLPGNRVHKWWQKFALASVYINGFYTIRMLNILVAQYGGSAYYFVLFFTVFIGFPIYYLEYTLGQFSSIDSYSVFARINPAMGGIGVSIMCLNLVHLIYAQRYLSNILPLCVEALYSIFYTGEFELNRCLFSYNLLEECRDFTVKCDQLSVDFTGDLGNELEDVEEQYTPYNSQCMQVGLLKNSALNNRIRSGADQFVSVYMKVRQFGASYTMSEIMTISWAMILITCFINMRATMKVAVSGVCLNTIVMLILTVIHFFYKAPPFISRNPTETNDFLAQSFDAFVYVVSTLNLGKGGIIVLGSFNRFHNNALKDCILHVFFYVVFPMLAALLFDQATRNYYRLLGDAVTTELMSSEMNMINSLMVYEEYTTSLIFLVTTSMILYYIAHQTFVIYVIVYTLKAWLSIYGKDGSSFIKRGVGFFIALASSTYLTTVARGSFDTLEKMEKVLPVIIILLELASVFLLYGPRQYLVDIDFMLFGHLKEKKVDRKTLKRYVAMLNQLLLFLWVAFIPCFVIYYLTRHSTWANVPYKVMIAMVPIPLFFVHKLVMAIFYERVNISSYLQPDRLWGPREEVYRQLIAEEHMRARLMT